MTEQEQRTLQLFETRTRQLILQYRDASELNRQLQDELRARNSKRNSKRSRKSMPISKQPK